jgi:hypothetical protein
MLDLIQMLLDQNRAFQSAFALSVRRIWAIPLRLRNLLFFNAYQHLGKQITLQFLPRLTILANANMAMQAQLSESREIKPMPIVYTGMQILGNLI